MNPLIQAILNSPAGKLNPHLQDKPVKKSSGPKPKDKTKNYIKQILKAWTEAEGLALLEEYVFDDGGRKFRFDWCCLKDGEPFISWEYEGIFSAKSRHTTKTGYSTDAEKYNLATLKGWQVYRYTQLTYKNLSSDLANIKI